MEHVYSFTEIKRLDRVKNSSKVIGIFFEEMSDEKWKALMKKINEDGDNGLSLKEYLKETSGRYLYFSEEFNTDNNQDVAIFKYLFYDEGDELKERVQMFEKASLEMD